MAAPGPVAPRTGVPMPVRLEDIALDIAPCVREAVFNADGEECVRIRAGASAYLFVKPLQKALMGAVWLAVECGPPPWYAVVGTCARAPYPPCCVRRHRRRLQWRVVLRTRACAAPLTPAAPFKYVAIKELRTVSGVSPWGAWGPARDLSLRFGLGTLLPCVPRHCAGLH